MHKLKRAVIKEELVILTSSLNEAIVLNQLIFWSERAKDSDNFLQEEIARAKRFNDGTAMDPEDIKKTLLSGWVYKTAEEMLEETMLTCSRKTMDRIFTSLTEKGFIDKRRNPKYKWDKTWQYRVNLQFVSESLNQLGYALEGYTLWQMTSENEQSKTQNKPSNVRDEGTNEQNDQPNGQIDQSKGHDDDSKGQSDQSNGHGDQAIPKITTKTTTKITTEDKNNVVADATDDVCSSVHDDVINYLNQRTGRNYNAKAKGNQKYINARIAEGYTREDLKTVIDNKVAVWLHHPKWSNYLRPSTLFNGDNFDAYLNEIPFVKNKGGLSHEPKSTNGFNESASGQHYEEWRNYSV